VNVRIWALVDDRSRVEPAGELVPRGFTRAVAVLDLAAADAVGLIPNPSGWAGQWPVA
jgi:hypothetical protein